MDLREHLLGLLDGKWAHAGLKKTVEGVPVEVRGKRVRGLPYSLWELLEHIRITQRDILRYMTEEGYEAIGWPEDYWPPRRAPEEGEWEKSIRALFRDAGMVRKLVHDEEVDLLARVPCGAEHTLLREVLLLADHNAYHLGQMVVVRRLLGIW